MKTLVAANLIGAAIMITMADYALSIPVVYKSWSTGQCHSVAADPGIMFDFTGYSCQHLPKTYDQRWTR
jgi:hypothetical protein